MIGAIDVTARSGPDENTERTVLVSLAEASGMGLLAGMLLSVTLAFSVEGMVRVPWLDWGSGGTVGDMSLVSIALLATAALIVPLIVVALPPAVLLQWYADRRFAGGMLAHALLGAPIGLLATVALFILGGVPTTAIPAEAFVVNAFCGAVGGLVTRQVLRCSTLAD